MRFFDIKTSLSPGTRTIPKILNMQHVPLQQTERKMGTLGILKNGFDHTSADYFLTSPIMKQSRLKTRQGSEDQLLPIRITYDF